MADVTRDLSREQNVFPRVLIAAPTSDRHKNVIKKWQKAVDRLDYPKNRLSICLVDTSLKKGKYGRQLRRWGKDRLKVVDLSWNVKKEHVLQMLARAREEYRKLAWKHNFDYVLHLDTDVIIPRYGLKRLLSHDKEQVGFVVHAFYTKKGYEKAYARLLKTSRPKYMVSRPAVYHSGNILLKGRVQYDYFSWKEIKEAKKKLVKVYASSIACLLVKKKVYASVPFTTHPSFVWGEDMWYYQLADKMGFEVWCDTSVRCRHLNTDWEQSKKVGESAPQLGFHVGLDHPNSPNWKKVEDAWKKKKVQVAMAQV